MKNKNIKTLAYVLVAGVVLSSCGLGKMAKKAGDIKYDVVPNPLQVNGDKVEININGKFPEKFFVKKASAEFTPVLVYANGETEFPMEEFQGESAAGNATVIPYDKGGSFSYTQEVDYNSDMEVSELMVKVVAKKGSKSKEFDPIKIADGVITTPYLVQSDDRVLIGGDKFVRTTSHSERAIINYMVNSSKVRPAELKDDDMMAMKQFIADANGNVRIALKGMDIQAYASPEGEISMNENLADERAASASVAVKSELKKNELPADDSFFRLIPKGEDWEGFKDLMSKSNIEDKDLILKVLEMYTDLNKREQEIKNMAATYVEVADQILPELRRSQLVMNYDKVGRSDEEISNLATSNPSVLDIEELLYGASLTTDIATQEKIYKAAESQNPQDWRAANNVGYVYMMQNNLKDATKQFEKAKGMEDDAVVTNNLGVVARLNGDREKAAEMYTQATSAGSDVNYNLGIVNIQDGDYEQAVGNLSGDTFNAALAKLLNGDYEGALRTIDASDDKDTAMGYYLKAVLGSRMNNLDLLKNNLGSAIGKDGSLKAKAKRDAEFLKYKDSLGSILN